MQVRRPPLCLTPPRLKEPVYATGCFFLICSLTTFYLNTALSFCMPSSSRPWTCNRLFAFKLSPLDMQVRRPLLLTPPRLKEPFISTLLQSVGLSHAWNNYTENCVYSPICTVPCLPCHWVFLSCRPAYSVPRNVCGACPMLPYCSGRFSIV